MVHGSCSILTFPVHVCEFFIYTSIQGALQLKQDFDLIRDLIRSEEYSLSDELYQKLLSLRVFHQVDNAIVCLLQQPMAKPYLPSRSWEPFRHCCEFIQMKKKKKKSH